jgi:beta-N-acetylhexosaminidase
VVYEHAKAYIAGLHEAGVISSLKHFPGFGSETGKKHNGFFDISSSWSERELEPYKKLISDSSIEVDAIMVSHVFLNKYDSEYPASLSKEIIQSVLRTKLNYQGVIIGESPQTKYVIENYGLEEGIRLQILAGVDIIQFANNLIYDEEIVPKTINIITKMINNKEISEKRIQDSYERIMKLKAKLNLN